MTSPKLRLLALSLTLTLVAAPFVWRALVKHRYGPLILELEHVPEERTAVVFGAAVFRSGRLSTVLRDRMDTAIELYHLGKASSLLVSGTRRGDLYDEPGAMARYAISRGVPASAIVVDELGFRTYDTCYWAARELHLNSVVLVTQSYHLPRALFTCKQLGLDAVGVSSDLRSYRAAGWYEARETMATIVALADVIVRRQPGTDQRSI